jgi:drug/metabolite transporter (DMT)-like permease
MEGGRIWAPELSFYAWVCIAVLGIGVNAIGTLLFLWIARTAGAGFVSYVGFIIPSVAVILGTLSGEPITVSTIGALACIVVGLIALKPRMRDETAT